MPRKEGWERFIERKEREWVGEEEERSEGYNKIREGRREDTGNWRGREGGRKKIGLQADGKGSSARRCGKERIGKDSKADGEGGRGEDDRDAVI